MGATPRARFHPPPKTTRTPTTTPTPSCATLATAFANMPGGSAGGDVVFWGIAAYTYANALLNFCVVYRHPAFTARNRSLSHAALPVREAVVDAVKVAASQEVALVFGNETVGLSNEDVIRCNRVAFIPTDAESSSLNLAAAVQIAAYELRLATLGMPAAVTSASELAPHDDMERFFAHLEQSISDSGFLQVDNPRRMMERLRRQFGRSGLEKEEVHVWRGMLSAWDEKGKKS